MSRLKLFPAAVAARLRRALACRGGCLDRTYGQTSPTNWTAIGMFVVFVILTLAITKWAADRARSAFRNFIQQGGDITGLQNGLAIAGDFMSAASFLGISGSRLSLSGYDGLIYSVGFLVGWPIVTFSHCGATPQSRPLYIWRCVIVSV